MIDPKELGKSIRYERDKTGMTQGELASRTKMSRNYISDIENGRYTPSVSTLSKIAEVLEVDFYFAKK
ncbi:hypothetical protein JCM19037_4160 [Geomicrobium sp. JCM 19037]|uniref:helix-turn-helix domain-containing protein n=1 Tax=Geomicrobium sp. JCM 19037 TaxID=1460634 RepID=UPI00045F2979|nr:helix-turn-helix transcriptional regulator [Geomicrobium sp. JCM 19037]GAK05645.1 hypothetical protein JCM19037_4160 [Geomicrobium sp. JCM 19037]